MDNLQLTSFKEQTTIVLMPYHLKNISKSIQNVIPKMIFTCRIHNSIPSIVIAVKKVSIVSEYLETFDDQPQMFIDIEYTVTLLQLHSGSLVKGRLVQQFKSHMIVQIFNIFNVLIPEDEINEKYFVWNENFNAFMNRQNEILENQVELQIKITEVTLNEADQKEFQIKGSLKDRKQTGQIEYLENVIGDQTKIEGIIAKSLDCIN
ncbi:unnamed protein product [Paramecium sonneborni]|uniref:Uncharacterized protein n=1 Tax=Paramecium sonneborni TaxID=65129 RepID=A0A8S1KT12_9CILI|nr:unnamed protein product [Paramecium sonneborni]